MDEYRYMSLFLSVKDFISLTSCNKNLRRLYFEKGTIWKTFLERDFYYKSHPSYDVERYKVCHRRKNINFSNRREEKENVELIYIDFIKNFSMLRQSLENWGLIHNNRPVLNTYTLNTIVFCVSIFSNYMIDLEEYGLSKLEIEINRFPYLIDINRFHRLIKENDILIYKNKACDLFYEIAAILYFLEFKNVKDLLVPGISANPHFFLKHKNYQKAKSMWSELGF
jgi:hypothetical protein